jgi:hypothetical protein
MERDPFGVVAVTGRCAKMSQAITLEDAPVSSWEVGSETILLNPAALGFSLCLEQIVSGFSGNHV